MYTINLNTLKNNIQRRRRCADALLQNFLRSSFFSISLSLSFSCSLSPSFILCCCVRLPFLYLLPSVPSVLYIILHNNGCLSLYFPTLDIFVYKVSEWERVWRESIKQPKAITITLQHFHHPYVGHKISIAFSKNLSILFSGLALSFCVILFLESSYVHFSDISMYCSELHWKIFLASVLLLHSFRRNNFSANIVRKMTEPIYLAHRKTKKKKNPKRSRAKNTEWKSMEYDNTNNKYVGFALLQIYWRNVNRPKSTMKEEYTHKKKQNKNKESRKT